MIGLTSGAKAQSQGDRLVSGCTGGLKQVSGCFRGLLVDRSVTIKKLGLQRSPDGYTHLVE
jgi:hypothetical protein